MLRRSLPAVLAIAFVGSLGLAACSEPSDPNAGDDNDTTTGLPDDTGGGGGMDAAPDDGGEPTDTATDDGTVVPDGGGGECERSGQESPHSGGTPSTDPLQNSAGLKNVLDKIESIQSNNGGSWPTNSSDEAKTVALEEGDQIEITDAVVTATSFKSQNFDAGQQHFWLQDSDEALIAYLDEGEAIDCPIVRVGDRVSLTVTGVKVFDGVPQISTVTNYRRNKEASSDAVPYTNKTGKAITNDDFAEIVKVSGKLTEERGSCGGGAVCFTLTHGGESVVYRATGSEKPAVGTCLTFFGPVNLFEGPLSSEDKTVQLQTTNFDWTWTEMNMNGDAGSGMCEPADFFNGQIFRPDSSN